MEIKVKKNIKLFELKDLGFKEHTFGLYGSGDYLPTYWFEKNYWYKRKLYYIKTNHCYFCEPQDKLICIWLYKAMGGKKHDKEIPLKGRKKIVKIVIDDLLEMGLVEEVEDKGE